MLLITTNTANAYLHLLESSGGDLVAKHSAQITDKTVTALEVR
jgi:hypothetical protein